MRDGDITDGRHSRASPKTHGVEVGGTAILFDRPGGAKDDIVAAFVVIPAIRRPPGGGANLDGHSAADVIQDALVDRGLTRVTRLDPDSLREMSKIDRWLVINDRRRRLIILEPTGCLFDGILGKSVPEGWYASLARQRALVLLVSIGRDLPIDSGRLTDLCQAGSLMGGLVAVRPTSSPVVDTS
jgi:hypothetical protein